MGPRDARQFDLAGLRPLAGATRPRGPRSVVQRETRPIGRAFGIPASRLPRDLRAFEAYWERTLAPDGPIHPSSAARDLAQTILNPPLGPVIPPLGWLPPRLYAWTLWPAVGLLPDRVREEFGLPFADRKTELAANLAQVEERIAAACAAAGRKREEVTLIVVTKTYPASDVRMLSELGVRHVAENRDQDAAPKAAECADLPLDLAFCRAIADQ